MPPEGNRPGDVEPILKLSLDRLGLTYVDLYLVHDPVTFMRNSDFTPVWNADGSVALDYGTDHIETWKVFITFLLQTLYECKL